MRRLASIALSVALTLGSALAQDGSGAATADTTRDKRLSKLETEVEKLSAIRITGYVQAEWQHFDQTTSLGGRALYSDGRKNFFTVRRGRIKFNHRLGDVMSYTIQPDITESGVVIKEAFVTLNLAERELLRLDAGMFNRPSFEVEMSSSVRESPERSQVVRAFYPGERDLGLMLTSRPELADGIRPRLQLGLFNGPGTTREVDAIKDLIGRLTLPLPLGKESPLKVDVGASYYYGGIPQSGSTVIEFADGRADTIANPESGGMAGFGNNRNAGIETQIQLDLLPFGSTIVRGEILSGQRATAGSAATPASVGVTRTADGRDSMRIVPGTPATPLTIRRQSGYYLYLVQNIGKHLQLVGKYDYFDRNTDLAGSEVRSASESAASVIGLGVNVLWERFRLMVHYEMPRFSEAEAIQIDPATRGPIEAARDDDAKDNKTTIRFQYRF